MISSALSYRRLKVPEEYDKIVRDVMFFLYTRPLTHAVLGHADHLELHHWALVAIFEDESARTLEGIESEGVLTPNYIKECPQDSRSGKFYELIPMKISPYKLHEVTRENRLNGSTYNVISNNCQEWVKAVAKAISPNLATALKKYRTNGEVSIIEKAVQCSWASSRSSSEHVASTLKELAEHYWSDSTNLVEHKLE